MVKRWLLLVLTGLVLSGCSLLPSKGNKQGALQVTSNGAFSVYLDETFLGQTPFFDEKIGAGEYVLRLVPSSDSSEGIWQNQVRIAERALTVVHYEWGGNAEISSSEVLELEPLANAQVVELSLTSLPDNVVVKLDGELKGFSPIVFDEVSAGDHVLHLEAPGYKPKTINLKTNSGYRLRVTAQLARDPKLMLESSEETSPQATSSAAQQPEAVEEGEKSVEVQATPKASPTPTAKPSPTPATQTGFGSVIGGITSGETSSSKLKKPYIQVLETGTGWLRVRSEPSGLSSNEVAKIKVGTYFPFVDRSENEEWVEIEYQSGKKGWVSSQYVKVVE